MTHRMRDALRRIPATSKWPFSPETGSLKTANTDSRFVCIVHHNSKAAVLLFSVTITHIDSILFAGEFFHVYRHLRLRAPLPMSLNSTMLAQTALQICTTLLNFTMGKFGKNRHTLVTLVRYEICCCLSIC